MHSQKSSFIILQIIFILTSFTLIAFFQPVERGWWIFKETKYYEEYFAAIAFIITSLYMILLTFWYDDSDNSFNWKISAKALLLCGAISIILCRLALYPMWYIIGFYEVETGWWIFKSKEIIPRGPVFNLFEISGAIAGPIEEVAKLIAVLLIPSVRKSIKDSKSGLFVVVLCAFGFAMIENITYFSNFEEILLIRADPAHAVFSAIWGKALGKWLNKQISYKIFLKYLLYGMALHAAWNYFAGFHIMIVFWILFIIVSVYGLFFIKKEISTTGS